jgi:hypothetical protein
MIIGREVDHPPTEDTPDDACPDADQIRSGNTAASNRFFESASVRRDRVWEDET